MLLAVLHSGAYFIVSSFVAPSSSDRHAVPADGLHLCYLSVAHMLRCADHVVQNVSPVKSAGVNGQIAGMGAGYMGSTGLGRTLMTRR
jgi:hypothetical protein